MSLGMGWPTEWLFCPPFELKIVHYLNNTVLKPKNSKADVNQTCDHILVLSSSIIQKNISTVGFKF